MGQLQNSFGSASLGNYDVLLGISGNIRQRRNFQTISRIIEHCIIGETFFFASSPILGAFYNNEILLLFIDIEQAISQ